MRCRSDTLVILALLVIVQPVVVCAESSTQAGNLKTWILMKSFGKATCHSYVSNVLPVACSKSRFVCFVLWVFTLYYSHELDVMS